MSSSLIGCTKAGTNFMEYFCDNMRHLVCVPYSLENLHEMANALNIKMCWFHKDHYDIPKRRIEEITSQCNVVTSKDIVNIINKNPSIEEGV